MRPLALLILLACASPALAQSPAAQTPAQTPEPQTPVVQAPSAATAPTAHQLPTAISVLGADVRDQDGKTIGRIIDVLVSPDGHPRAAVVDFGGFMGVGARRVAVDWSELRFTPAGGGPALLALTPDQLRAAPDYKDSSGPVSVVGAPHPLITAPAPAAPAEPVAPPVAVPSMPAIITPATPPVTPPPGASH